MSQSRRQQTTPKKMSKKRKAIKRKYKWTLSTCSTSLASSGIREIVNDIKITMRILFISFQLLTTATSNNISFVARMWYNCDSTSTAARREKWLVTLGSSLAAPKKVTHVHTCPMAQTFRSQDYCLRNPHTHRHQITHSNAAYSRGGHTCSVKGQIVTPVSFAGHPATRQRCPCSRKAVIGQYINKRTWVCSNRIFLWTLHFEFHIFMCHEILYFWFLSCKNV